MLVPILYNNIIPYSSKSFIYDKVLSRLGCLRVEVETDSHTHSCYQVEWKEEGLHSKLENKADYLQKWHMKEYAKGLH